jgi:hypothetical protein
MFAIERSFRGALGPTAEMTTGMGGGLRLRVHARRAVRRMTHRYKCAAKAGRCFKFFQNQAKVPKTDDQIIVREI